MAQQDLAGLTLRYRPGAVDYDDLAAEVMAVLQELGDEESATAAAATELGLDSGVFTNAQVSVDQEGKGFAGEVILLITIVRLAPSANHVLKSVWDEVVLPRVKSRIGADAVGDEVRDDDYDDDAET